jgi:hypothetical protein
MRYIFKYTALGFILLLNLNTILFAQSENENVMKPINLLFEGMEKADTSFFKNVFAKNVIMKVVSDKGVKNETVEDFIKQIANKPSNTPNWIEKLYNTEIRVDGNLAHVWTDYSFYVGDKLSHCGVDSFALIKLKGVWKIVFLMDTRRYENCEEK